MKKQERNACLLLGSKIPAQVHVDVRPNRETAAILGCHSPKMPPLWHYRDEMYGEFALKTRSIACFFEFLFLFF